METITPAEVAQLLKSDAKPSIIDVREHEEVALGKIPGARHIPLGELQVRLEELDKDQEHILVCHSGGRSGMATNYMTNLGYKVKNMVGGMLEWEDEIEA
ncbi:rhodanese-like domain-containing protein [Bacillus sp. Marseille-P3661]|uniref:rhodanese-like domain-containing protein n=1 Tax=Bacillus sp. Marseille-P3661 TaxID=1936234 RepID=UPI000C8603BC|nr:rhodanese-like domain-containing protein [Bacillus sp. Marseille-P3661]